MTSKEKLVEATQKALLGKLVEVNENNKELEDELLHILRSIETEYADEYRYKGFDVKITNNTLKMYYQTQSDIEKEDIKGIISFIKPLIKKLLKEYNSSVTDVIIDFYDRSGRWENNQLRQTFKVTPSKSTNKETSFKPNLSKDRIQEIVNIIMDEDYDTAYEYVGGASGNIYEYLHKEAFNPECKWSLDDLERFTDVDVNNKSTMKAIALQLIKEVCAQEDWSISTSKSECGYNFL